MEGPARVRRFGVWGRVPPGVPRFSDLRYHAFGLPRQLVACPFLLNSVSQHTPSHTRKRRALLAQLQLPLAARNQTTTTKPIKLAPGNRLRHAHLLQHPSNRRPHKPSRPISANRDQRKHLSFTKRVLHAKPTRIRTNRNGHPHSVAARPAKRNDAKEPNQVPAVIGR